jgi:putative FmdB family regulatory protein
MPIYAYACKSCGHVFDAMQKISEPLLTECPSCKRPDLKKQLTAPGFQLKGAGWYATDFKGKKGSSDAGNDSGAKSDSASGDSTTGDSTKAAHSCGTGGCGHSH